MNILYIDDYKKDEEITLRGLGVQCNRELSSSLVSAKFAGLSNKTPYILRGPKLPHDKYKTIFAAAQASGISLDTNFLSYSLGNDFSKQYNILRKFYPKSIVVDANKNPSDIFDVLIKSDLKFPLFVKSEAESAAKYVGTEGCIISDTNLPNLNTVINNLRSHVSNFTQLVFKEVVEIETTPDKQRLEFRAIGLNGSVILFDFSQSSIAATSPEQLGLDVFAKDVLSTLSANGANGSFFIDVALCTPKRPVLIECKNLVNGNIKFLEKFAAALR